MKYLWRNVLFSTANYITNWLPNSGAWLLNKIVPLLLSNKLLLNKNFIKYLHRLKSIESFDKILVIGDLNIGDAINLQASIYALRDFFPESEIDYVVSHKVACLLDGNPEISTLYPVFSGNAFPHENDFQLLLQISKSKAYDVIFNFCPFFKDKHFSDNKSKVISFSYLASTIIRNESQADMINHIILQAYQFIYSLFIVFTKPTVQRNFTGIDIALSDKAISLAKDFLRHYSLYESLPTIFLNPDTSSKFTRIPLSMQIDMVKALAGSPQVASILLGAGHSEKHIEEKILQAIPYELRQKITIVPASMPLNVYAGLIDLADVFISGDTGPLHIAASRQIRASDQTPLRNQTAIYSIFGATPARIYGYDSAQSGFFPSNQDAPAHTCVADSPCRNITCINKSEKNCKTVRCFQELDVQSIVKDIESYLKNKSNRKYYMMSDMIKIKVSVATDLNVVSL